MSSQAIRSAGSHDLDASARALADAIGALIRGRLDFGTMRGREAEIAECLRWAAEDRDVWTLGEALGRVADAAYGAWDLEPESGARYREQRERLTQRAQSFDVPGICEAYAALVDEITARAELPGPRPTPKTDGQSISVGTHFSVVFQRTLRIPDDGKTYPLPPGLGPFPIRRVSDHLERVPRAWRERPGFIIPLYQREALWLSFRAGHHRPVAVKIAIGGVSAISGRPTSAGLGRAPQDYVVCPKQPWLDGIASGDGHIRQFVAMALGQGYTVEAQITGQETVGGVQLEVFGARPGQVLDRPQRALSLPLSQGAKRRLWEQVLQRRYAPPPPPSVMAPSPARMAAPAPGAPPAMGAAMGLGGGGRIEQQIFEDPQPAGYWAREALAAFEIHIVNSEEYRAITGEAPPPSPVSAKSYTNAGFPWFDYYDEKASAIGAATALANVQSIAAIDAKKGLGPRPEDLSVDVGDGQVIDLSPGGPARARQDAADHALRLMQAGRHDEALRVLEKLRVAAPEDPVHPFNASLCLFHLGRYEDARDVQLAGPPEQWDRPEVSHNLACIEAALGRADAAVRYALRAIKLDPAQRAILLADGDLASIRERLRRATA